MSTTIDLRAPETSPVTSSLGGYVRPLVRGMRPPQWIKNALVVAAPAAAGTLFIGATFWKSFVALAAMCAASSATYLVNDLGDIERDRVHPTKRLRPLASGQLSPRVAQVAAVVLLAIALTTGALLGRWTALGVATYLALTLSYSRWLKHVPFIELAAVAAGFMLRVVVGAVATSTSLSVPFLVVVTAGAFFLATGKRLSELIELGTAAAAHRPVLGSYQRRRLERVLGASIAVTVAGYSTWAISTDSPRAGFPWLILSILPVIVAIGRVTRLTLRGDAGDPTGLALHDRVVQGAALASALVVFAGLYVV